MHTSQTFTLDMPKPRVLCLHGRGSNNDITEFQVMGLKLTDKFTPVYLQAPHKTISWHQSLNQISKGPFYSWADSSASLSDQEDQWEESLVYIAEYCNKHGPFDGVYGFSQGASIITNFSAYSIWKDRFKMKTCPWKFAMLACGGANHHITIPRTMTISIPSFHIFGKKDAYLNNSKQIADYWNQSTRVIETKGGGHEIDMGFGSRETELMSRLNDFIEKQLSEGQDDEHGLGAMFSRLCCENEFYLCGITFGGR